MDFDPPKISTANFFVLVVNLVVFVAVIFLLAKLYYEANQLALIPESITTFLFIIGCLFCAWFYRINFEFIYPEQEVLVRAGFNVLGFAFIKVILNGRVNTQVHFWNASDYQLKITETVALDCRFKPCDAAPKGGCRLIISEDPSGNQ